MPYRASMEKTSEKVDVYLEGIYNTVIVKDIEDRQNRRESDSAKRKVTDIALLKTIARFTAGNYGGIQVIPLLDWLAGQREIPNHQE